MSSSCRDNIFLTCNLRCSGCLTILLIILTQKKLMIKIKNQEFEVAIPHELIEWKVKEMADQINKDYQGKSPTVIVMLTGAFIFAADLIRKLEIPIELGFAKYSSYEGTETTGIVKETIGATVDIADKDVLIVEDIIDTGTTMKLVVPQFYYKGAKDVKIATLLRKPSNLRYPDLKVDYCGMDVADKFLVGYGLDYDEEGRWLRDIYEMV